MIVCPALEEALLRRDDQAVRRLWDFQHQALTRAEAQRDALLIAWNADVKKYANTPSGGVVSDSQTRSQGEPKVRLSTARQPSAPKRREVVREAILEEESGL
jgi:hypothetical protein